MTIETILYAFLGGLLPALIWLYVWLREDSRCPEPRGLLMIAFVAGMVAVPLVLPLQKIALLYLAPGLPLIVAWATAEEVLKYVVAAVAVLWRRAVNEPIDLVIYMLTVALGFAAAENMLFLINPLAGGNLIDSFITGNLRFIGSTLLHVLASGTIGFALAFSYTRKRAARTGFAALGLILAIALHAGFYFLILGAHGEYTLTAFLAVWSGAVVLFALFEILKYARYRRLPKNAKNVC